MRILYILSILFLAGCNQTDKTKATAPVDTVNTQQQVKVVEQKQETDVPASVDIVNWVRKNPAEIGCILEKEFSYHDPVFNCSVKKYVNKGDPCKNTKAYYEGVVFPNEMAAKVHPLVKEINFDFEGGRLREINITFKDSVAIDKVKQWFKLPGDNSLLPENVMSIQYGENVFSNDKPVNPAFTRWLTITGFEHMGAGDVDCE